MKKSPSSDSGIAHQSTQNMAAGVSPLQYALLFLAIFFILQPCQARLYSVHDDIILLDNSTIHNVIYDSPVAWIVEFYSTWCGHCQAFAPTWKKVAQVVRGKTLYNFSFRLLLTLI